MREEPSELHLVSLNVCGLSAGLAPLAERAAYFGRRLEESGVVVASFQEVWTRWALQVLRAHLPSFRYVAWRRGVAGQPAGGLLTLSRVPVGAVSYTSFRGLRPRGGSVRFRATGAVNSMLQGVLTAELPRLGAVVANTHLTANHDGDWSVGNRHHPLQRAQLERLHTVLRPRRAAGTDVTVVSGDFNIASDAPLYPLIVDGDVWRDPFAGADPVTFQADFLPPGAAPRRIDYTLVHGDPVERPVLESSVLFADPVASPTGRMYVSDHMALALRIGGTRTRSD